MKYLVIVYIFFFFFCVHAIVYEYIKVSYKQKKDSFKSEEGVDI